MYTGGKGVQGMPGRTIGFPKPSRHKRIGSFRSLDVI
jgi:hypothetical protein